MANYTWKAILVMAVTLCALFSALPRVSDGQCFGGNPYDNAMIPVCCADSQTECLSDASCASAPDNCGSVTLSLFWDLAYQGVDEYFYEGQYNLSGVCYPTWQDCDCNWQPEGYQSGYYSSSGGYNETDVWASWTMVNMEDVRYLNCPSGTPCAQTGTEGPFILTFTDYNTGYIDLSC